MTGDRLHCQELHDLIIPYAAEALDADERRAVGAHLATGCPRCTGTLAEAQALLATIPLSLDSLAPTEGVKQRLFDRIDVTEQDTGAVPIITIPPPTFQMWLRVVMGSAIAAIVAITVTVFLGNRSLQDYARRVGELQSSLGELHGKLDARD